jgi:hypothetical protein
MHTYLCSLLALGLKRPSLPLLTIDSLVHPFLYSSPPVLGESKSDLSGPGDSGSVSTGSGILWPIRPSTQCRARAGPWGGQVWGTNEQCSLSIVILASMTLCRSIHSKGGLTLLWDHHEVCICKIPRHQHINGLPSSPSLHNLKKKSGIATRWAHFSNALSGSEVLTVVLFHYCPYAHWARVTRMRGLQFVLCYLPDVWWWMSPSPHRAHSLLLCELAQHSLSEIHWDGVVQNLLTIYLDVNIKIVGRFQDGSRRYRGTRRYRRERSTPSL